MRVPGGLSGFCIFTIRRVAVGRVNKSCGSPRRADATSTCKFRKSRPLRALCVSWSWYNHALGTRGISSDHRARAGGRHRADQMTAAEANAADQLTTLRRALSALDNHIELERKELKRRTAALEKIDAWMEHEADEDASSDYGDTDRAEGAATLDLARVMEDRGDIETAAILCERVLEHRRSTLGSAHPRTQAAVRKLATLNTTLATRQPRRHSIVRCC